jgi:glycolate oxidase
VLKGSRPEAEWEALIPVLTREIFEHTVKLGGMLSGEHGIGCVQRDYLPIALDAELIRLQRNLKQAFDPDGILNPGKLFPEETA